MKYFVCCSVVLFAIVAITSALKCYECSGSEMSDCAKGLKTAGVEVTCTADPYGTYYNAPTSSSDEASSEEGNSEETSTTTESHYEKMRRLGCFKPMELYPACVSYSRKPYNGVKGEQIFYRSCMLTGDDFCKKYLDYNKESTCRWCNSTDFCQ